MKFVLTFAAVIWLMLMSACSTSTTITTVNTISPAQPAVATFMAGAATTDITPPPGVLPRAGYATWSTVGNGFRTRLYARAYYLRDNDGDSHVIVQTDLATGSRVLQTRLGEVLAEKIGIDTSRITITSTHTHSGPGQIVGSQFYNKHISHKSGFAKRYFDFLVKRISNAVIDAHRSQRPAKLATGKTDIWGLTRNRSIEAHVLNKNVKNKSMKANRTFHKVNPSMYMIRIDAQNDSGQYEPLGAFASFSIHGTALPEKETLFNADVWAYVHKNWEWHIKKTYSPKGDIHISAFEGTHGDVAPANRFGMLGYIEARRVGEGIAKHAIDLFASLDSKLTGTVDIHSAARYVNLRKQNTIDGIEMCDYPALGTTLAGAPLEHTSPVIGYIPPFKAGSRRWFANEDNCQGRKRHLGFKYLINLFEPRDSFPDFVIFQLIKINDMAIVPMPFEITTESGYRLENAVKQAFAGHQKSIEHVMISSLANGYTGYITTPEEYGRQNYEGGSTLYGKYSLPYLTAHLNKLTNDMLTSTERLVELPKSIKYEFDSNEFLPKDIPATGKRQALESIEFTHAFENAEQHWTFKWRDVNISKIELHKPLVSIQTRTNKDGSGWSDWQPLEVDGVAVNDQGYDVSVRLLDDDADNGMAEYQSEWYNPLFDGEQREYRFVIEPRDNQPALYSKAFN